MNFVKSFALVAAFVIFAGTATYAAPTPFIWTGAGGGNPSCATLNASSDSRLSHMSSDGELKLDPTSSGSYQIVTSGNREVIAMTSNPNLVLNVQFNAGGTALTSWSLTPNTAANLDRLISAIIIKGGNGGAHVYPYNPLDNGDTGPFVLPTGQQISHVSFCFEPFTAPSAADATVSGRVLDRYGRGISSAVVSMVNLNTGETVRVPTNAFGYYVVKGLTISDFYNLGVYHSRYSFVDPVRTFSLDNDLAGVNFVATR